VFWRHLSWPTKLGLVVVGYAAAWVVASTAVYVHELHASGAEAQASAGMYAFGDLALFAEVFGVLALAPTALAFYFLRPVERFWTVLSVVSLVVAATGPVMMAVNTLVIMLELGELGWDIAQLLALARLSASPFLAVAFLTAAVSAPARSPRWTLLASALVEAMVAVYAFLALFVLGHSG
jgi:hypothetical protein